MPDRPPRKPLRLAPRTLLGVRFTLADFLQLAPVAAGKPQLIAGAAALERPVRWAHAFETLLITESVAGGEALLTTGIELERMTPQEVDALIADLARQRVTALALELVGVFSETPQRLIDACQRHDLPLIVFPSDVFFQEIIEAVAERRLAGELARLRGAVGLQTRLLAAAQEGLGAEGLVAALASSLGVQVMLETADGVPIATAPEAGLDAAFLAALDDARARRPTPLLTRLLRIPGGGRARLHVLFAEEVGELEQLAVEEAALVVTVALSANPPSGDAAAGDRARLLRLAAEGRVASTDDLRRRARSLGVDLGDGPLAAVVLRGLHHRAAIDELEQPALAEHLDDGRSRLLVAAEAGEPALDALAPILRALAAGSEPAARSLGIGCRGDEPWELRLAFDDADRAALVAAATGRPLRRGDDLGALSLTAGAILAGDRPEPPLSDRDARILQAFASSGFAVSAAARGLGVSRQTLYVELRRAAGRLELDPLDPSSRAELGVRLLTHELQREADTGGSRWP